MFDLARLMLCQMPWRHPSRRPNPERASSNTITRVLLIPIYYQHARFSSQSINK